MSSHKVDVLSVQEVATNDLQNQDAARLGELGYQQGPSTVPLAIDAMLCLLTFLRDGSRTATRMVYARVIRYLVLNHLYL